MEFGASIFFTDYSISPTELAVALEERGFDSFGPRNTPIFPSPVALRRLAVANWRSATTT